MARPPKGYWDERRGCYYARVGGRHVRLNDPSGAPVARDDTAGRLAALARLVAESGRERPGRAGLTVRGLLTAYIAWQRGRGAAARTINTHRFLLNHWGDAVGPDRRAAAVGVDDWSKFRQRLEREGKSPRSVESYLDSVRACWRWAARAVEGRSPSRLLEVNPFADLLVDIKPGRRVVRGVLEPAQVAALLASAAAVGMPECWRVVLAIQAGGGCRTDEAIGLRWEWWRGTHFSIPPESHKTGGRTGRARTIAVTAATARMIEEWRPGASVQWVARAAGDIRRESRPANNAYLEWFRLAREHAGLPEGVTPYWLRTSFTAHARRAGAEPRVSAASAGHSAEVALRHYDDFTPEELRAVVERVERERGREGGGS